jgi:transposase
LFDYDPSRSQSVPLRLLEGFEGYLGVDGYDGYNAIGKLIGIYLKACWAHARRKFNEALKAQASSPALPEGRLSHAKQAMNVIQALYRIEREAREMTPEQRFELRKIKAKPLLNDFRTWLDQVLPSVPPQSLTGKALHYVDNQWSKLLRYLEDGRLSIDSNLIENAIRPYALGRRAWLFCDTVAGAKATAAIYSLIECAKASGHEPFFYLRHVITELPNAKSIEDFEALLPYNIKPEQISRA